MYFKILLTSICISNTFGLLLPCENVTKYLCTINKYYAEWKPPTTHTGRVTVVDTEFDLNHIINVDEEKHTIVIFLRLKLKWKDPRVKWKKTPWENMMYHTLHLPFDYPEVWVPQVHFSNAMELEKVDAFRDSKLNSFIFSDPYLFEYSESLKVKILCPMTFTDFPFDTQICTCRIRNWLDRVNEVFMNPPTVIDTKNVKLGLNGTPTMEEWSNLPFGVLIKPLRSTVEFEDGFNFSTAVVQIGDALVFSLLMLKKLYFYFFYRIETDYRWTFWTYRWILRTHCHFCCFVFGLVFHSTRNCEGYS